MIFVLLLHFKCHKSGLSLNFIVQVECLKYMNDDTGLGLSTLQCCLFLIYQWIDFFDCFICSQVMMTSRWFQIQSLSCLVRLSRIVAPIIVLMTEK